MHPLIEKYRGTKTAIHCPTQQLAYEIDKLIVEAGGRSLSNRWRNSSFCFNLGDLGSIIGNTHCRIQFFMDRKFVIIPAEKVLNYQLTTNLDYSIF